MGAFGQPHALALSLQLLVEQERGLVPDPKFENRDREYFLTSGTNQQSSP